MASLLDSKVRRGPASTGKISFETDDVSISSSDQLIVYFDIGSKGGGKTYIQLEIGSNGWMQILNCMAGVNKKTAMQIASKFLESQLQSLEEIEVSAKVAVLDAAEQIARNRAYEAEEDIDGAYNVLYAIESIKRELLVHISPQKKRKRSR